MTPTPQPAATPTTRYIASTPLCDIYISVERNMWTGPFSSVQEADEWAAKNCASTPPNPQALPELPTTSPDVFAALEWIDDFIARCNGDDRGACESVNVIRAALAQPPAEPVQAMWISVNDRLPTHHHGVLGVVIGGGLVRDAEDAMVDIVSYGGPSDPRWLQFVGDSGDAEVQVSHWMAKPDAPSAKHDRVMAMSGAPAEAFEAHCGYGTWIDPAYRQDAALWAAAWRAAERHLSTTQPPSPQPERAKGADAQSIRAPYDALTYARQQVRAELAPVKKLFQAEAPKRCAAGRDGDCFHKLCPQNRDGEPAKSGRHCPLNTSENDE